MSVLPYMWTGRTPVEGYTPAILLISVLCPCLTFESRES